MKGSAGFRVMKTFEETVFNGCLGKAITRAMGKPGSLRFRLARDTIGVFALKATSMGLGFLISVILARLLGVREFGLYAFAMSLVGLLSAPAAFGFPQLLVREIAAYRVRAEWGSIRTLLRFSQRIALGASLMLAALAGLGLWLFSDRLSQGAGATLGLALVSLPFMALVQLQGSALQGFDKILEGQMVNGVLRPLSFLVLIGGVWLLGRRFLDATVAMGLQTLAAGLTLIIGFLLLQGYVDSEASKTPLPIGSPHWVRSALWFLGLDLLNLMPQHFGPILLGIIRGSKEVGLYKAAYQMASLVPFGLVGVNIAIGPTLSRLYVSRNLVTLGRVVRGATALALALGMPLVLLYITAGAWVLEMSYGSGFSLAKYPLVILTLGFTLQIISGPSWLLLVMSGNEKEAARNLLYATSINIVANLVLIPGGGMVGAAAAIVLYFLVVGIMTFASAKRVLR